MDARTWSEAVAETLPRLEPDLAAVEALGLTPHASFLLRIAEAPPAEPGSGDPARQEVIDAMTSVYGRVPAGAGAEEAAFVDGLDAWVSLVGDDLVTQAILTTDGTDRRSATFAAVHWPSPLAPRLRVVRIPDELRGRDNREEVLASLGTCAVEVDEWMSAPEEVALRFLEDHVYAAMLIVGRDVRTGESVERWIEPESLIAALRFEDPRTANLDSFSAWFAGEAPPPLAITRLLPHLRGSLGPGDLWDLYRSFGATSGGP